MFKKTKANIVDDVLKAQFVLDAFYDLKNISQKLNYPNLNIAVKLEFLPRGLILLKFIGPNYVGWQTKKR